MTRSRVINTRRGTVRLPAYMPVTTWGDSFPLDGLVRPFLKRYADAVMVSFFYAKQMGAAYGMATFVDSGGFALLQSGSTWARRNDGTAEIRRDVDGIAEVVSPEAVLALQINVADMGSTLDLPIPPGESDPNERVRRLEGTLANARWALGRDLPLHLRMFGSVQGWDVNSYAECAAELRAMGYADLAIGGLVPRLGKPEEVAQIVGTVARVLSSNGMLHCFGVGQPGLAKMVFDAGATSCDSSSFVRTAVDGRRWDGQGVPPQPSPLERCQAAIANLAYATRVIRGDAEQNGIVDG